MDFCTDIKYIVSLDRTRFLNTCKNSPSISIKLMMIFTIYFIIFFAVIK